MDYERISKPIPQGGGLSPGKLREMLLGVEKRRKQQEEEDMESKFSRRLKAVSSEIDDRDGNGSAEDCKDVDIVSSYPDQCSATTRDQVLLSSRIASSTQADDPFDSESVTSAFEFHKSERATNRPTLKLAFAKPAPSKWDDAQKWISNPTVNRPSKNSTLQQKKLEKVDSGSRQLVIILEDNEDADTKRIDLIQAKTEFDGQKPVKWTSEPYPLVDSGAKPDLVVENLLTDSATTLSHHGSSAVQSVTNFSNPPQIVRSVAMRDMGTEMTPIASQEPSRTSTPITATSPLRSPTSSRPSTPQRTAPSSNNVINLADVHGVCNSTELSERELQMRTRREIIILGTQLGKTNIAAWASKEEEEKDASISLKTVPIDQPAKSVVETRAAAWEEAERARYMARFNREEIKIEAWENHQRAKTEAEMRKIEVEVERMRAHAHDRLMSKLAASKHKAEEMRAAAEARRNQQAAKTAQQTEYIRRTGRIPSSFSCCRRWCF